MRNSDTGKFLPPLVLGLMAIAILTAVFVIVTSPTNAISTSGLPNGVNVSASGVTTKAATATAAPPRLPNNTLAPSLNLTPSAVPNTVIPPTATPTPPATESQTPEAMATPEPPTPTPAPIGIIPARLRVPSIGVDAPVEKVAQTKDGAMDTPKNIWDVGWYEPGSKPGELGSAVIAGHLDGPNTKAIFWDLNKVKVGQKIFVSDAEGKELTFEVIEMEIYPFDKAPLDKIFVEAGDIYLNLITCNGTFDQRSDNYNKRLVVYTKLVKEGE